MTLEALRAFGANTAEGLERCLNDEPFYLEMVAMTLADGNFEALRTAMEAGDARGAFAAAHALKGAVGNVARIIHTISFDTTSGNRHENNGFEVVFSGSAPMTVSTYSETGEHETLANRTVSFEGLKMRVNAAYLPSGIRIDMEPIVLPASWTALESDALADGFLTALSFDVIAGGETVHIPYWQIGRENGGWQFEIPLLPSDYAGLDSITIIPVIRSVSGFVCIEDVDPDDPLQGTVERTVTLTLDGEAVPIAEHFRRSDIVETPLTDTRIVIALPKN